MPRNGLKPSFIAPRDHFLAAVTFSKARDDVSLVPTGTPGIGAAEALKRVSALDKAIAANIGGAAELFRLRNGEAHLGTVDATYARRTLVSFLRAINTLLKIDPDKFWAPHHDFVRTVLDETSAEVVRRTASKVAAARAHFNHRRSVLSKEEAAALDAIVDGDLKRRSDEEHFVVDCPACESSALLSGENSLRWGPEYDEEGPSGASPCIEYVGGYLYCDACGLELVS